MLSLIFLANISHISDEKTFDIAVIIHYLLNF